VDCWKELNLYARTRTMMRRPGKEPRWKILQGKKVDLGRRRYSSGDSGGEGSIINMSGGDISKRRPISKGVLVGKHRERGGGVVTERAPLEKSFLGGNLRKLSNSLKSPAINRGRRSNEVTRERGSSTTSTLKKLFLRSGGSQDGKNWKKASGQHPIYRLVHRGSKTERSRVWCFEKGCAFRWQDLKGFLIEKGRITQRGE